MSKFIIYPRGYTSGSLGIPELSAGDLVIDALYEYFLNSKGKPLPMTFREQVLEFALIQFGDFHTWLDLQLANKLLTGSKRDYLLDTVNFISGKGRSVHQSSWQFILDEVKVDPFNVKIDRRFESKKYLEAGVSTSQVLQRWCSQDYGMNDLIVTLHVLFGHIGRSPV